jgi:hypothetical protein
MSQYVHATEPSLEKTHVTLPGDAFKIRPGASRPNEGGDAIRTSFLAVHLNLLRIFRFMNMTYPEELKTEFEEVVEKYVRPHRRQQNS